MKTISIDHPLRTISYQTKESDYPSKLETAALEQYRLAHDQVWRMKCLFETEKGEVQLTLIDLLQLDKEQTELNRGLNFYKDQINDSPGENLHTELAINFQVELRNFYNSVIQYQHRLVKFYDVIGVRDAKYSSITETYLRGAKPIDPLRFSVLEPIFMYHADMDVDIASLDVDLQQFLLVLNDVYTLLDRYTEQYNLLYRTYMDTLKKAAQLTKDAQVLQTIWGD